MAIKRSKKFKKFSNLRLAQHILLRLWRVQDAGGVSHGRSYENRLLEAAMKLMIKVKRPAPFSDEELLNEAFIRNYLLSERSDRRRRNKEWLERQQLNRA